MIYKLQQEVRLQYCSWGKNGKSSEPVQNNPKTANNSEFWRITI